VDDRVVDQVVDRPREPILLSRTIAPSSTVSSIVAPRSLAASPAARTSAPRSTSEEESTPRASMRARERISPSKVSIRAVASRMRATNLRASSGSASAPSSSTSALARMAATGFLSSWERSAANVSRKGLPSSSLRIESMAWVRRFTSCPCAGGGTALVSPSLTRTAKLVRPSMGVAMARPITAAARAAAAPSVTLINKIVGAKSASSRRMMIVG